jgi:hypothetical protein
LLIVSLPNHAGPANASPAVIPPRPFDSGAPEKFQYFKKEIGTAGLAQASFEQAHALNTESLSTLWPDNWQY